MVSDISLGPSSRKNLISLQDIERLSGRTEERLTTGKKVNSVLDDAVTYFRARTLTDLASDYETLRQGIDQGVSALETFINATDTIDRLLSQMKGLIEAQRSTSKNERKAATLQFKEIGKQIYNLVEDAQFQGIALLSKTTINLDVRFGRRTGSKLVAGGYALHATTATTDATLISKRIFSNLAFVANNADFKLTAFFGANNVGFSLIGTANTKVTMLDDGLTVLEAGIDRLRGHAAEIGVNAAILQIRLSFTQNYVNNLESGADKLVLADLNEEGANLVALQTRQQLGLQALRLAGQNDRAIIQLLQ